MKSFVFSMSGFLTLGLSAVILLSQTGCASYFKRKECESTNWFEYGQKVAMTGKRLSGDQFVGECHKVEAEMNEVDLDKGFKSGMTRYCQPAQVFALGKSGEFFSPEMCDGENPRQLGEKHKAGVLEYCAKTNGYAAGAAGKAYNGICPKAMEGPFMPEFRRGRKKYLAVLVVENEKKISDLENEATGLQNERNMKFMQSQQIAPIMVVERRVDPATGAVQMIEQRNEANARAADDMRWQIQNLDSRISGKRQEQTQLRDKNREIKLEAVALDDKTEG